MSTPALTMAQWASTQRSDLVVTSESSPQPVLMTHNLIGRFDNSGDARKVLLAWERIEAADAAVGMVAMGRNTEGQTSETVDPEGVAAHAAKLSLLGAIPGAIVGGLIVAALVVIYQGGFSTGGVVGGLLGGVVFGAIAGGMLSFVRGTGWGSAYQESFVDDATTAVVFASIHSNSPDEIDAAHAAAVAIDCQQLTRVDRNGHPTD